ncbi:hypothetical protein DNU06_08150 [Putridiphycobacter roseus]|uniref:Lipoprotein n=1 Tax=Putridiphycobacter roseus TaxID=2219161 RepID=A0A2W1NCW2_9FLAO|nr:hypothetical protein [Putridiphycobacter roseus]PZE17235.1 hypothetical protein DNU06_08150 [Putridiphycobacter roseus]
MNIKKITFYALISLSFIACQENKENSSKTEVEKPSIDASNLAVKPSSWIEERVEKAKSKLAESEAGQLIWQSMEAHGGLNQWFSNGVLSFRFDYIPVSGPERKSTQQIDTWSNRAVHQSVINDQDSFGWDGENAWVSMQDSASFPFNMRFWALTPYTFVGQPFIFDGAGVVLEKLADQMIDSVAYDVVKVTYEAGTGDAPDDYYVNYFDKSSHLLKAIKYIVSYPTYFKDGGHSPEKLMVLNAYTTVEGITLPSAYTTYAVLNTEAEKGDAMTEVTVSNLSFLKEVPADFFEVPVDAEIISAM